MEDKEESIHTSKVWGELDLDGINAITDKIEDAFTAIISRIAHGDKLKEVSVQDNAPKLAKVISLLDTNWSEKILLEALSELFMLIETRLESFPGIEK